MSESRWRLAESGGGPSPADSAEGGICRGQRGLSHGESLQERERKGSQQCDRGAVSFSMCSHELCSDLPLRKKVI